MREEKVHQHLNIYKSSADAILKTFARGRIKTLVTAVRGNVSMECGQFPTMKIHLIYVLRYQPPNLFP